MAKPFELLTDKDKDLIVEYINRCSPANINEQKLDVILKEWDSQKDRYLINLFGGKDLILSRPFTYTMTKEVLKREFDRLYSSESLLFSVIKNALYTIERTNMLPNGLSDKLLDVETLIDNGYAGNPVSFVLPDGKVFKISKGMKPMKIIHKLFELYDQSQLEIKYGYNESNYERFRQWHSKLFNQANIDGQLCISIHPLDYMTMSDNANGWESCMRWASDSPGDYRAGTVECMNSPYLVVAYLHNPNHTLNHKTNGYLWGFPDNWEWNSKRWRELFLVQDGVICEIKGYPYQDENLTNAALMWIKELAYKNLGWEYNDEELNVNSQIDYPEEEVGAVYSVFPEPTFHMYQDVGSLPLHRMRVNLKKLRFNCENKIDDGFSMTNYVKKEFIFTVPFGGYATCMNCGGWMDENESRSNSVLCEKCAPGYTCERCGDWIEDGDAYWVENSEYPICYDCFEYHTTRDDLTDMVYLEDDSNMYRINWLIDEKNKKYYGNYIYVYEPEYNDMYEKIFTGAPKFDTNSYRYYITTDMIKDKEEFAFYFGLGSYSVEDMVARYTGE